MTENEINQLALSKYPIDEFWIGDLASGRMYDQNARDRAVFIKGVKSALSIADISQQRKLLLAFMNFYFSPQHKSANTTFAEDVDAFLANNCA